MVVFLQKSPEKGHVTLCLTNQRTKFTMKSHFWWDFLFAPFHLKSIPLKSSAKNQGVLLYFTTYMAVSRCRTSEYKNFTIVSPSRTEGHTITFELVSSLIRVLPMWFIDYSFCVDQHVLINYNFVDALVPDEGRWQSRLNSFKGNCNFVTLFPYMILKTNISLPLPYLDCIKHCWGEQNSTVNSVHADDWTAELAISASKGQGELIYSLDTNQGPFHIVIFSLFFVSKRKN